MSENEFSGNVDFESSGDDSLMIDLNSVEDSGFQPLPKGMYNCAVESLEFTYSQSSGNPMWSWTLEIEDGEFAGRKLFFHTVFKGAGLPITKRAIARVAPELMQGAFDPRKIADEGTLIGRRLRARVTVRMYKPEGADKPQPRNNVAEVFAASSAEDF